MTETQISHSEKGDVSFKLHSNVILKTVRRHCFNQNEGSHNENFTVTTET